MGFILGGVASVLLAVLASLLADEVRAWLPWITERVIQRAAGSLPADQRERYREEWRGHLDQLPGEIRKFVSALGLFRKRGEMSRILTEEAFQLPEQSKSVKPRTLKSARIVFGTPVPREASEMTNLAILGANANSPCPKCGYRVAFFSGEPGAFISDVKPLTSDTLITLKCPIHGSFNVPAGEFHDKENELGK